MLNRKGKTKTRGAIRGVQKSIRRAYVTLQDGHAIQLTDQQDQQYVYNSQKKQAYLSWGSS